MTWVLVKSLLCRQGFQLSREVKSVAQGHIQAKWWGQDWKPVILTADGICRPWQPALSKGTRWHMHAVAREPSRARLCTLGACHALAVAVGDHSWAPPEQRWSRAHPSCLVTALLARVPLAHMRDSPSSPLSSQHHYLPFSSFLGFPLLPNWQCSGPFFQLPCWMVLGTQTPRHFCFHALISLHSFNT